MSQMTLVPGFVGAGHICVWYDTQRLSTENTYSKKPDITQTQVVS